MMSDSSISKNIQISDLHDWEIFGVNINRFNKTAEVILHLPDKGSDAILRLQGVQKFFLSGMMVQNVILDVLIFEESSNSDYFMRSCQLLKVKPSEFEQQVEHKILYIEPTVGTELACYFSHFKLIECNKHVTRINVGLISEA